MSLLGLLLLIGVVVDDAIVVLENVYRTHEALAGYRPLHGGDRGHQQVGFAVIAASLTLVSIFGSVLFLQGIVARFFQSFAVVVTVGVLVSLFVSLTLTPMLCSRFLDVQPKRGAVYDRLGRLLDALDARLPAGARLGARTPGQGAARDARGRAVERLLLRAGRQGLHPRRGRRRASWSASGRRSARAAPRWRNSSRSSTHVIRAHPEVKSAFIGIGFGGTSARSTRAWRS